MPFENIAPQDDTEVMIIMSRSAQAPTVTRRDACFAALKSGDGNEDKDSDQNRHTPCDRPGNGGRNRGRGRI